MIARPIQTRWNGMVSPPGSMYISTTLTTALAIQPTISSRSVRDEPVANIADGLHSIRVVHLCAETPHTDVDHIAAGVELQSPDIGEDLSPTAPLAGPLQKVLE